MGLGWAKDGFRTGLGWAWDGFGMGLGRLGLTCGTQSQCPPPDPPCPPHSSASAPCGSTAGKERGQEGRGGGGRAVMAMGWYQHQMTAVWVSSRWVAAGGLCNTHMYARDDSTHASSPPTSISLCITCQMMHYVFFPPSSSRRVCSFLTHHIADLENASGGIHEGLGFLRDLVGRNRILLRLQRMSSKQA